MSKKKPVAARSKLVAFKSKRAPVAPRKNPPRRKSPPKRNPMVALASVGDAATNMAMMVVPGIGGYTATRLGGKFMRVLIGSRVAGGKYAKHFGPLGSLGALLGLMYASQKWEKARKYQEPIVIGSAIALFQSLLQTYLPGLIGLIDDRTPLDAVTLKTPPGLARRGLAGYQRGAKIRYVSPGELESQETLEEERDDRAEADEVNSQSAQVADELPPEDPDEPLSDAAPDFMPQDDGELSDLYDGVFKN